MKNSVMLAIKHRLCEEDIHTLQEAKELLQSKQVRFVCNAITEIYCRRSKKYFTAELNLHRYIRELITPRLTVRCWMYEHHPEFDNIDFTEYRLQWIDHMISDIEEAIAVCANQSENHQENRA